MKEYSFLRLISIISLSFFGTACEPEPPNFTWKTSDSQHSAEFDFYTPLSNKISFNEDAFNDNVSPICSQALVVQKIPVYFETEPNPKKTNDTNFEAGKTVFDRNIHDNNPTTPKPQKIVIELGDIEQAFISQDKLTFPCKHKSSICNYPFDKEHLDEFVSVALFHEMVGHACSYLANSPKPEAKDVEAYAYWVTSEYAKKLFSSSAAALVHVKND